MKKSKGSMEKINHGQGSRSSDKLAQDIVATIKPRVHKLPMKGTCYLESIMSGKKKFEGRVCGRTCVAMHVKDYLALFDREAGWGILCEIVSKDVYNSFEQMLQEKGLLAMLPQLEDKSKELSKEALLKVGVNIYQSFPGSHKVKHAGAVAIGVKFIKKILK